MNNQDTLLITVILGLGLICYFIIKEEFSWIYSQNRTIRKHKKTGQIQKKTYS
jgi:hypothetical protein